MSEPERPRRRREPAPTKPYCLRAGKTTSGMTVTLTVPARSPEGAWSKFKSGSWGEWGYNVLQAVWLPPSTDNLIIPEDYPPDAHD